MVRGDVVSGVGGPAAAVMVMPDLEALGDG